MRILVWNIGGFNKPLKQKELVKCVRRLNVSIICLVETRVREENVRKFKYGMFPNWKIIHNYSSHVLGRIWICWDPGITSVSAVSIHEQVLTCKETLCPPYCLCLLWRP